MRNRPARALFLILFGLCLTASPGMAANADAILGSWNTAENKSKIEIFKCGSHYCGKIAWLKEPLYPEDDEKGMAGQSKVDRNNPDPALRRQPLVGLQLMEGFSHDGDNRWQGGLIYDPENGKQYKCKLTLEPPDRLHVRGYIGFSLIGRTSVWTR